MALTVKRTKDLIHDIENIIEEMDKEENRNDKEFYKYIQGRLRSILSVLNTYGIANKNYY